jgi:lipopolysaccharide export system protein LptA
VWTPKRIVLLALGFVALCTVYVIYATSSLGRINGLPPLPSAYQIDPEASDDPIPVRLPNKPTTLEEKLIRAFGPDCPELEYPIQLEINARKMVVAAEDFQVLPDGRVLLQPLSLALFGKKKAPGRDEEINTLQGKVAYLTFDRPIKALVPGQVGARRIVAAELTGNVVLTNNRGTARRDDDLWLNIPERPLYFDEAQRRIWTDDNKILLIDRQSKPQPHTIHGEGMDVELLTRKHEPAPGHFPPPAGRQENISGVKSITLRSFVDMHLYLDGKSTFLGKEKKENPGQTHVHIRTPGSFRYEFGEQYDHATFEVQPGVRGDGIQAGPQGGGLRWPQDVTVKRHYQDDKCDQLVCQHLDLRLKRGKKPEDGEKPGSGGQSLDIEEARATARKPRKVALTSDAEELAAFGSEFYYHAVKRLTVVKGDPEMFADKAGSKIYARELRMQETTLPPGAPGGKPVIYQQVTAVGPGRIFLLDSKTQKQTMQAFWDKLLTADKEWDPRTRATAPAPYDLLVLTGAARFHDTQHQQDLKAKVLKVWLEPPGRSEPARGANAESRQGRRPHHVEATGEVEALSRELIVHDTARLVVWFTDAPVAEALPPGPAAPATPASPRDPATAPPAVVERKAVERKEPARPIRLSARTVQAYVVREKDSNRLESLWTEGRVRVRQEPAKPDELGLVIKGQTLQMKYFAAGNRLTVSGGSELEGDDMAQLQMDKIYILGNEVNIDQGKDKAWVFGPGAMRIKSATNFQGERLAEPKWLTIYWQKQMLFTGEYAEFRGQIVADQEHARLGCQRLQVSFDRKISLKRGAKPDQQPVVQHMACSGDVRVEDSTFAAGRRIKYQRIEGPDLVMRALEADNPRDRKKAGHSIETSGPGSVRLWQRGARDSAMVGKPRDPRGAPPGKADPEEMKLTYVTFGVRMDLNSRQNTANFWENVRVLHMPCPTNPERHIDLDLMLATTLPEGAMYLRCGHLKVLDEVIDGRSNQQMEASEGVYVQAREFVGRAATMTYNQAKDQVIFVGDDSAPATLWKRARPGDKEQTLKGRKIIYDRATGNADVQGAEEIRGQ